MCDCFSNLLSQTAPKNTFNDCFLNSVGKDTILLKKECQKIYGDSTGESFYKMGTEFFKRNSVKLIYTCDNYFKILDSTRYDQINSLNKDSIRYALTIMNDTDSATWNKDFLVGRGLYYFAVEDYNNALKDFDASLLIDPSTVQSLFFKAWVFEIKKNYDGAIELYSQLALITKNNDFNIYAAIAKRKKNSL